MFSVLRFLLLSAIVLAADAVRAVELAVIVHPDCRVAHLTREQVAHIFLGRVKFLPSGEPVSVMDTVPQREPFYRTVVGKGLNEINAYWARLRFSGRTQPPLQMQDARSVIERVANNRGAIGYVEASLVDKRVRVVMNIEY